MEVIKIDNRKILKDTNIIDRVETFKLLLGYKLPTGFKYIFNKHSAQIN